MWGSIQLWPYRARVIIISLRGTATYCSSSDSKRSGKWLIVPSAVKERTRSSKTESERGEHVTLPRWSSCIRQWSPHAESKEQRSWRLQMPSAAQCLQKEQRNVSGTPRYLCAPQLRCFSS